MAQVSPDPGFWSGKRVNVTGGGGFLGRPTVAMLEELGAEVKTIRSADFDLRDPAACLDALRDAQVVIHLAANVGGIGYNRRNPGPLAHDNLAMGLNVFEACRELGVEKLVAACSVCAYPKFTPVPFKEDDIWDGYPEESNAPYGLAKKMLLVLSRRLPTPVRARLLRAGDGQPLRPGRQLRPRGLARDRGDDPQVRRRGRARGSSRSSSGGPASPSREFLYVDDAARALILCAERLDVSDPVNIGTGRETEHPRARRDDLGARRLRGEDRLGRPRRPTASRSATSTSAGRGS